jgi:hypothetical protein
LPPLIARIPDLHSGQNLRRWEAAERQRWKAARESTFSGPSSVLVSATRRATSFWSRRASHTPADSGGRHRVLQTSEDGGHLEDVAPVPPSSALSPPFTPPSEQPHAGPYAHPSDPFSDPPGSTSSLFVNALPVTSDIGASASIIALEAPTSATDSSSQSTKVSRCVSAPAPLDLPEPRSPPPRTATPHANRPPEPFPRPDSRMSHAAAYGDEDEKLVRWWTEWLCGCSEGADRGGEIQVRPTDTILLRIQLLISHHRLAGRTLSNNSMTISTL